MLQKQWSFFPSRLIPIPRIDRESVYSGAKCPFYLLPGFHHFVEVSRQREPAIDPIDSHSKGDLHILDEVFDEKTGIKITKDTRGQIRQRPEPAAPPETLCKTLADQALIFGVDQSFTHADHGVGNDGLIDHSYAARHPGHLQMNLSPTLQGWEGLLESIFIAPTMMLRVPLRAPRHRRRLEHPVGNTGPSPFS